MVPLDKGTATMAYIVVIAPEEKVANGEITQEDLEDISREWAAKHLAGSRGGILRYTSLIASPESKSVDAMILLGGFSLRRIMEKSLVKYYDFKDSLSEGSDERSRIELERVEKLEKQLKEYIALTEEKIARLEGKRRKAKTELRKWGFSS